MNMNPFSPAPHSTVTATAGATSSNVAIPRGCTQVRVWVSGAVAARLEFDGTAATATSMGIVPGAIEIFSCTPGGTLALISTGADTTVELTFGSGS